MDARAVDEAAHRLHELRHEERGELAVAAFALGLALVATELFPALAVPLLAGGMVVTALGVRSVWRRWDLVERLATERDAHAISEVRDRAAREATIERRRMLASHVRSHLHEPVAPRIRVVLDDLSALASELDDDRLSIDPVSAVACARLLDDPFESPLLDGTRPAEELRSRISRIRSGFAPGGRAA